MDKESALKYLYDQLPAVDRQIQRIRECYDALRFQHSFPVDEKTDEFLKDVRQCCSFYGSKADQEITRACEKALANNNISNRNQIINEGVLPKLPGLLEAAKTKRATMEEQFKAFKMNRIF